MFQEISRKLDQIEKQIAGKVQQARLANCNCRGKGRKIAVTTCHIPEELALILAVPCPVHGKRDPGFVMYAARWVPINKEDWEFCICPPHARRDALMGRIPLPTDPEQRRARLSELDLAQNMRDMQSPPPRRNYKEDGKRVAALLEAHRAAMGR